MTKVLKKPVEFDLGQYFELDQFIELKEEIESLLSIAANDPKNSMEFNQVKHLQFLNYTLSDHIKKLTEEESPY